MAYPEVHHGGLSGNDGIQINYTFGFVCCALLGLWLKGGRDELQAYIFIVALLFLFITMNVSGSM